MSDPMLSPDTNGPSRARLWVAALIVLAVVIVCGAVVLLGVRVFSGLRPTPTPFIQMVTTTPPGTPTSTVEGPPAAGETREAQPPTPAPTPTYQTFFPDLAPPSRDIGLGISVAPHLPPRRDLLDAMGMDWVKVYDTVQIGDYPDRQVLFRINTDPNDLDGWERGLYDLAPELAGRGAAAVEIGNEPNLAAEWAGNPNPAAFADALCRAYRAVKETAPGLIVVSGGLAPAPTIPGVAVDDFEFARAMLDAGAGNCFDAFGYHPYGFDQPPEADPFKEPMSFRRAERMQALLGDYGLADRQMWITEFGWLRDPREEGFDCGSDPAFTNFDWMVLPRETQAVYTARAVSIAANTWPWAGPMFVWNLNWNLYEADFEAVCSHLRWYGILDSNGTPLPVYHALDQISFP